MNTPDPNRISLKEGDLKTLRIVVPDTLDMSARSALIQVRDRPNGKIVLEFSTEAEDHFLLKNGQYINWTIPAFLTVGKAGLYEWEVAIFNNISDTRRYARGAFEIKPSIVKL